jgi:hypothetical protein
LNKIVRDHYPVSRLPADLKAEVAGIEYVRLVIEDADSRAPLSRDVLLQLLEDARRGGPIGDDPVERIRTLRNEWND